MNYSPVFTSLVVVGNGAERRVGLRKLNRVECLIHAFGIRLPEQ